MAGAALVATLLAVVAAGLLAAAAPVSVSAQEVPTPEGATTTAPPTTQPTTEPTTPTTTASPTSTTGSTLPTTTRAPDGEAPSDPVPGGDDVPAPAPEEPPPATDEPIGDDGADEPTTVGGFPRETPPGLTDEQYRVFIDSVSACGVEAGFVCRNLYDLTGNQVLSNAAQWVVDVPVRVGLILAAAFLLRNVVRRVIVRFFVRVGATREGRSGAPAGGDDASDEGDGAEPGASRTLEDVDLVMEAERRRLRADTAAETLGGAATVTIFVLAGFVALAEIGVNIGPLLAGAGIAGVALGFGAQNLVRDLLAGIYVVVEDQYGIGDVIDAGRAVGTVEGLTLRMTKVRDVEGTLWFVPNGEIAEVGNMTQRWARVILDVEVGYGADHEEAGRIIKAAADTLWHEAPDEATLLEEPSLWGLERLGESGVALRIAVKCRPAEQWAVARELRSRIKSALDEAGIEIPFPQRTLWMRRDPGDDVDLDLAGSSDDDRPGARTGPS